MAQNEWRLLTFEEDYSQYSYWTWTTSCNSLANYKKGLSRESIQKISNRLSVQTQVAIFNNYCFYGLSIPYIKTNEFKCRFKEEKDPTAWLFKIGNEFFGKYFRILYANWTTYVYYFGREMHQPYSELLNMPMYEILLLFDFFQDDVKQQNEEADNRQTSMNEEMSRMRSNVNSMTKMTNGNLNTPTFNMPKMPDIGNLNMSNFKL